MSPSSHPTFQALHPHALPRLAAAAIELAAVALALAAVSFASAAPPAAPEPHRLGDHPAIVVQRLQKTAGPDYAGTFYPHPAWLWLHATPPADDALAASAPAKDAPRDASRVAQARTAR